MNQDDLKRAVAQAAIAHVKSHLGTDAVVGIGTGSTADLFIDELAHYVDDVAATVASSERSAARLRKHGFEVLDLNAVRDIPVYVDGADEIDHGLRMIKGGGAALTREKIVAAVAQEFVCIADESKRVERLGRFPLPIEVLPMARGHVARQLMKLSDEHPRIEVELREVDGRPLVTDNGGHILDVYGLSIEDPIDLEARIDRIVGVITNGLFAARRADVCLLGTSDGVRTLTI